jgi:hypothetical protein
MAIEHHPRTRQLIRAVRTHADNAGDGHAGWTAIADFWTDEGITDAIVYAGAATEAEAIAALRKHAENLIAVE